MRRWFIGLLAALTCTLTAAAAEPASQLRYVELFQAQPVETGDKVEVRELFWYGCPHCFDLEPVLDRWIENKPDNVVFVRTPAVLRESWAPHAQAYFAFEAMGLVDTLHRPFFDALHLKKQNLATAGSIADWVAEQGVDRQKFLDTYNSFAVNSRVGQARLVGRRYEADGVPTMIVDGKYRTSASMAGGHEALIKVIEALVQKAANERGTGG